jgi:hypothetical protein
VTSRHEERYRHVRVLRGGSWNNNTNNLRAANRNNNNPTNTNNNNGFRGVVAQYPRRGTQPRAPTFDARVRKPVFLRSVCRGVQVTFLRRAIWLGRIYNRLVSAGRQRTLTRDFLRKAGSFSFPKKRRSSRSGSDVSRPSGSARTAAHLVSIRLRLLNRRSLLHQTRKTK